MNGELAQVIALAAHGSAWLARPLSDPPRLEPDNSTFKYVARVHFQLSDPGTSPPGTSSVAEWLQAARERSIERFWLYIPESTLPADFPARMHAAFSNGARWKLIGTSQGRVKEIWRPTWRPLTKSSRDRRIWHVQYKGRSLDEMAPPHQPSTTASAERLLLALERIEGFARAPDARRHDLSGWADSFAEARQLGHAEDPEPPYHPDLLPHAEFGRSARQLLAMATRAWVFGGMGSWNDVSFGTPEQEAEAGVMSAELFSAELVAFVAATNSRLES